MGLTGWQPAHWTSLWDPNGVVQWDLKVNGKKKKKCAPSELSVFYVVSSLSSLTQIPKVHAYLLLFLNNETDDVQCCILKCTEFPSCGAHGSM